MVKTILNWPALLTLVTKLFVFQLVNNFSAVYYVAFVKKYVATQRPKDRPATMSTNT